MKVIILCLIMMILSGCDATYNIEINDEVFKENTVFKYSSEYEEQFDGVDLNSIFSDISKDQHPLIINDPDYDYYLNTSSGATQFYKSEFVNNSLTFTGDFNLDNIKFSSIINTCASVNIVEMENLIKINSDDIYKCFKDYPLLNNIEVNINVSNLIKYENADFVNNNTYTWNFKKDEEPRSLTFYYQEKEVSDSVVLEDDEDIEEEVISENDSKYQYFYVIGMFCLFIFIVICILKIKRKDNY